jgi:glycine/D-amino acid oxidase-like deaminating enzyme
VRQRSTGTDIPSAASPTHRDPERSDKSDVAVVGGGLAGLGCAIECAERGASVELHEAAARLGGRARHLERQGFVTNQGPHALYLKGPGSEWLEQRGLLPDLVTADVTATRFRHGGRIGEAPSELLAACRQLGEPAPESLSFAEWARSRVPAPAAKLVERLLTLPTYDGQPGRHAASSVQAVLARTLEPGVVTYVRGGWGKLVEALAERARDLGVELRLSSRVEKTGRTPTVVATGRSAAARLLGDARLAPDGQAVALRDLGLREPSSSRERGPVALLDLDDGAYVARYSAYDRGLAPVGYDLLQCCAGLRPGEKAASAQERIERVLDAGCRGWRKRAMIDRQWQTGSPGSRDAVGGGWETRPAVDRGDGVLLVGDWVAAPGLLSEVCFTSATTAAELVTARAQE